jgi:ketosteroid isomerase-like protein
VTPDHSTTHALETGMTANTTTSRTSTAAADIEAIGTGFRAVAAGDLAGFAAAFHPDATWNHRNDDRLGGIKHGVGEIVDFLVESMKLTAGTLKPVPDGFMPDGQGRVAVLTRVLATRPDGRSFEDTQILLFTVTDGQITAVDQFVGDPTAVTAFWA